MQGAASLALLAANYYQGVIRDAGTSGNRPK
jgi:hypothetical protein